MKKICQLICIVMLCTSCVTKTRKEIIEENHKMFQVSLIAAGDNLMHQSLLDEANNGGSYDFKPYYRSIKPYIEKYDLSFINQESILGGKQFGYSGYPLFNTPDEMAEALCDTGFDVVNGSNNHALDMFEAGVDHALKVFSKYKEMTYIGLKQKEIPVIYKNGIKIAFLAYNHVLNGDVNSSSIQTFDKQKIAQDIEKAKQISDCIIVSCHWGKEYDEIPDDFQKEYAQFLADEGVDVIIGSHSHTLQPIEWLKGRNGHQTLVAYSLGNFLSSMMEEETQLGGLLAFDIIKNHDKINIEHVLLIPIINHYQVHDINSRKDTRYGFQVYLLKDYTDDLAGFHGLNGYHGIFISVDKMKNKVKDRITGIDIDM